MLSQGLMESWNVTNPDDPHLKELMERIVTTGGANNKTPAECTQFHKNLMERLEKRKLDEIKELADTELNEKPRKCCWRRVLGSKRDSEDTEIVWHRMECKTMEFFVAITGSAICSSMNSIRCLKAITQSLSYWEDPHPDWEGLSVIGGYIWLLSFAVQHLIDDQDPKGPMVAGVREIKNKFQEIAQSGEIFSEMMEHFHKHTHRVRTDAILIVKKMLKKWKLEDKSPFNTRPEQQVNLLRLPKRRLGNQGLPDLQDEVELFKENVFTLNWSPQTVMLKSHEFGWMPFGNLTPQERVNWFLQFGQKALDILELAAEDLTMVTGQFSSINIEGIDDTKSHARELSGALLGFANSCSSPKNPTAEEKAKMLQLLSEYWFCMDILHEEGYKLLRLVHETRDIVRTCYVYMDTFYKWDLPSYDAFLTTVKIKRKGRSQTITNIREVWDKFISTEGDTRKLSDVSEILVMMDFSTSAYQSILEMKPIESDGSFLKLEPHSLDPELGYGLISGVDKRKSKVKH